MVNDLGLLYQNCQHLKICFLWLNYLLSMCGFLNIVMFKVKHIRNTVFFVFFLFDFHWCISYACSLVKLMNLLDKVLDFIWGIFRCSLGLIGRLWVSNRTLALNRHCGKKLYLKMIGFYQKHYWYINECRCYFEYY